MKKADIQTRSPSETMRLLPENFKKQISEKISQKRRKIFVSKERLKELYWDRGLGIQEISKILGCSWGHVYDLMKRLGVPVKGVTLKPKLNPTPELSYVLSVALGDGSVTTSGKGNYVIFENQDR